MTLVIAVYKFDRMEWAIEKTTELGVSTIVPIIARRTEKHLALSADKRVERWRRLAHEAAKQSRRADLPAIEDPIALATRLSRNTSAHQILLAEDEHTVSLRQRIQAALKISSNDLPEFEFAIGPEGGWTPEEISLFAKHNWQPASLGPRILRAETAAIATLAGTEFCITGELSIGTRKEVEKKLEALGAIALSDVRSTCNLVIVGDKPGSKLAKAA